MLIKQFFRPTKAKITTALIIPILILIYRLYSLPWCPPYNIYSGYKVCLPQPDIFEPLIIKIIIFSFIIVYLLVCGIVFITHKSKKTGKQE